MPIAFETPSPLGSAVSAGVGAGAAGVIEKELPTLAAMYGHLIQAAQGHGGGGGGGGGGSYTRPGIGENYSGGGGSGYLGSPTGSDTYGGGGGGGTIQPDYVGQHLQLEHQYKMQQLAQRQAELQKLNGPPSGSPQPAPSFSPSDQQTIDQTQVGIAQMEKDFQDAVPGMEEPGAVWTYNQLQNKLAGLQQKKQAADQYQQQAAYQAASQAQAQKRALIDTDLDHADKNSPKQIPDLPTPIFDIDANGKKYMVNHEVYKAAAARQLEIIRENGKELDRQAKAREAAVTRAEASQDRYEQKRAESFGKHLKEVNAAIDKWDPVGKDIGKTKPDWHDDPYAEASKRAQAEMDFVRGAPVGNAAKKAEAAKPTESAQPREEAAGPIVPPSPQLAQQQVQRADSLAEQVKALGMPVEHTAEVMSALTGLKELNSAHGGNLNSASEAVKKKAQEYRDILLKYGPRPSKPVPSTNHDARAAHALAGGW